MEIFGTNFTLSLGSWRFRLSIAVEDQDGLPPERMRPPHRMRVIPQDEFVR